MKNITFYLSNNLNFGSFLILLIEINYIRYLFKIKKVNLILDNNNCNYDQFTTFYKITNNLKFDNFISINYFSKINLLNHRNTMNFEKIFYKSSLYSFETINNIFNLTNKYPLLVFKKKLINSVLKFIKKNKIKKFITIHLKHDPDSKLSNTKYNLWRNSLNNCKNLNNKNILFVGNDAIKDNLNITGDNFYFSNDFNLNISEQLYLVSISSFFIGTASGFCCAANFSNTPYIIIKHPDHHKSLIKKELQENKLPFSKFNQNFIFMRQTSNNIDSILSHINV
jgi:hypothetical protein